MSKETFLARYGSLDHAIHLLDHSDNPNVGYNISCRKDLTPELEHRLANHSDMAIRTNIGEKTADPNLLDKLSKDPHSVVRRSIVWNDNAQSHHLGNVMHSLKENKGAEHHFLHLVTYHANVPKFILEKVANEMKGGIISIEAQKRLENGDYK